MGPRGRCGLGTIPPSPLLHRIPTLPLPLAALGERHRSRRVLVGVGVERIGGVGCIGDADGDVEGTALEGIGELSERFSGGATGGAFGAAMPSLVYGHLIRRDPVGAHDEIIGE